MPEIVLEAEVGRPHGSPASRRLRAEGKIPGVVYGHGTAPVPVAVAGRDLRVALSGEAGTNALLSLRADGKTYLTVARELQRHPVKGTITHVDFQIVRRDEIIAADVPIVLIGEAIEVHHGDGHVDQQLFTLPVRAKPADIPTHVDVEISGLTIGAVIRVGDLPLQEGVSVDLDDEVPVVTGVPPRVQALEEEAAAAEGEAAAEAGEGAEPSAHAEPQEG
ncbi:MAG TPA: 50S ribosomal protein L25 [Acidimicrobiales bacterium]|jgi:large subunit ribosomal protein L25|nr:50S ribosomal protein L25 [Acidimicrobiales bacterium]